jgi:hypothetical protein
VKLRDALTGGLLTILGVLPVTVPGTYAADAAKPSISKEAAEDLLRMGHTLHVEEFSFQAKTIRVYLRRRYLRRLRSGNHELLSAALLPAKRVALRIGHNGTNAARRAGGPDRMQARHCAVL